MSRMSLLVLMSVLTCASTAMSQQRVFIGVGIDEYDDDNISPTPYCVSDVKLLARILTDKERGTFQRVSLLHSEKGNGFDQPTKANIERELIANLRNLNKQDTVVFFFAGHGYVNGKGQGFLITKDTDPANLEATAICTASIRRLLSATEATKVCILDCCHAGARALALHPKFKAATGKELGREFAELKNVLTIASCDADQESHPLQVKKQGMFTFVLSEALVNDDLDQNSDGFLEAAEIYVYVRDKVKQNAKTFLNKQQVPALITLGKLPDVKFTKAIGGTKPFASNFGKERGGLVPEGWKGNMVVQKGVLMPSGGGDKAYSILPPPQRIRDGFKLDLVVDYVSVGRDGTRPTGKLRLTLANKNANPWTIEFHRGYFYYFDSRGKIIKKDIQKFIRGNQQTTVEITVKRIVSKRGASITVYVDGSEVGSQLFHKGSLTDVRLDVLNNRNRTPEIHSVAVNPLKSAK
ncbi:MAG: caspase domain-containing protein [Gemmataceae bacterium]